MRRQTAGGDLSRLRRMNALLVLRSLREAGMPLTLSELAERTGLSRASVEDLAGELEEHHWIIDVPPVPGTVGRPARRYRYNSSAGHVLGLDVGAHKVLVVTADLVGNVLATARVAVRPDSTPAERLDAADAAVAEVMNEAGVRAENTWAVSAGTTGVVSETGEITLSGLAAGWTGTDLVGHLRRSCSGPVAVDNDTRLAALAEHRRGAAQRARDVVYVHAGLQTSGALIIGGRLHRGFTGAAAEMGSLPTTSWEESAQRFTRSVAVPAGTADEDAAAYVLAAARRGDHDAILTVDRYANDLAMGTAAMVATVDPELVVLGGGLARSADLLLPRLETRLRGLCIRVPELRPSPLGEECVAVGAVELALDHVDAAVFSRDHYLTPPSVPCRD